jgi:acetyl esterase/lipase
VRRPLCRLSLTSLLVTALLPAATSAGGQSPSPTAESWVADLASRYAVTPDRPYLAGDGKAVLDVYAPRTATASAPVPTVIYFHGGAWLGGDKSMALLRALPYLEMGWAVVNANYRLGSAPLAVMDGRCALRWVAGNASTHGFDIARLVVTGDSSGAHLALTTGLLDVGAGFDSGCDGAAPPPVAAIVNWFGVTDVADVLEGPNRQAYVARWFEDVPDATRLARRLSPLQYVRAGGPAVITIHGDADTIAPYSQAVRLHRALDQHGIANRLITIRGGQHGGFARDDMVASFAAIRDFLEARGVVAARPR